MAGGAPHLVRTAESSIVRGLNFLGNFDLGVLLFYFISYVLVIVCIVMNIVLEQCLRHYHHERLLKKDLDSIYPSFAAVMIAELARSVHQNEAPSSVHHHIWKTLTSDVLMNETRQYLVLMAQEFGKANSSSFPTFRIPTFDELEHRFASVATIEG